MNETKSVKSLKKQLAAAIAMVTVAAVALGSSTYAWFVSSTSVKATTTKISAQSNSAYLVIDNANAGRTTAASTGATTASEQPESSTLYPAQWAKTVDTSKYQFETAYATDKGKADEKENTRFAVGDPTVAASAKYAFANTFYIGTGTYAGIFKDLKVSSVSINNDTNSELESAMRVLVTCGDAWAVWSKDSLESSSDAASGQTKGEGILKSDEFGEGISADTKDATVTVYVYYDGADENVFSDNLGDLKDCGVTITFEATPTEYGKTQA